MKKTNGKLFALGLASAVGTAAAPSIALAGWSSGFSGGGRSASFSAHISEEPEEMPTTPAYRAAPNEGDEDTAPQPSRTSSPSRTWLPYFLLNQQTRQNLQASVEAGTSDTGPLQGSSVSYTLLADAIAGAAVAAGFAAGKAYRRTRAPT
jgi:hypothetical protein